MFWKQRFAPFLVLLEARYLPLLLLALPQSYTVAIWLTDANKNKPFADFFAVIGALAFEASYVGAIAWTEHNTNKTRWMWITAASALIFSVLVAVRVYWQEEYVLSFLHAGFPIVAFFYTMLMHSAAPLAKEKTVQPAPVQTYRPPAADGGGHVETKLDLLDLLNETEPLLVGASVPVQNATAVRKDWRAEALRLAGTGMSATQIALAVGKDKSTVSRFLNSQKGGA